MTLVSWPHRQLEGKSSLKAGSREGDCLLDPRFTDIADQELAKSVESSSKPLKSFVTYTKVVQWNSFM